MNHVFAILHMYSKSLHKSRFIVLLVKLLSFYLLSNSFHNWLKSFWCVHMLNIHSECELIYGFVTLWLLNTIIFLFLFFWGGRLRFFVFASTIIFYSGRKLCFERRCTSNKTFSWKTWYANLVLLQVKIYVCRELGSF